ncbi:MAG TPA: hypothetical protein VMU50_13560 [Polyangia bacterium]|nr:hypothetical protein [Polyangia bacterium]
MLRWIAPSFLSLAVVGCGAAGGTSSEGAGTGGRPAGGGGTGGAAGAPGTATGGASGGGGGAAGGSGGARGGATGGAGNSADGGAGDGAPADAAGGACPPAATLCDDFESYADGATSLAPTWQVYTYAGGTVRVDGTKPFAGTRALHVTTPMGSRKYADIIKDTPDGTALLPLKHYGRVMVWATAMPSGAHWNISQAGGLVAGSTTNVAKYSYGGMNGKLHPNYTLRTRVIHGATPFRGGGPEEGDDNNPATLDCSTDGKTEVLPTKTWVCWEWMFDGAKRETHLWLDGVAETEVDVLGMGTRCQGANHAWDGPEMFTRVILGWEQYTAPVSEVNQEVWLDDLAMGPERIGCPNR